MVVEGNPVTARRYRGGALESIHHGCWALVDIDGNVVGGAGDPDQWIFARSSSKSLQQAAVLPLGVVERFGFTPEHLALMISSHNGEPRQVELAREMLDKIGLDESALQCGAVTVHADSRSERRRIHHGCSGKHAGFLAGAVVLEIGRASCRERVYAPV